MIQKPHFTGEQFEMTWQEGLETFRVYSKKKKNKEIDETFVRCEAQQYPNVSLHDAIKNKLSLYMKE